MGMKPRPNRRLFTDDLATIARVLAIKADAQQLGIWPEVRDLLLRMEERGIQRLEIDTTIAGIEKVVFNP